MASTNRFVLEIKQGGIWVYEGNYSTLDVAFQGKRRRFPDQDARVVNRDSGEASYEIDNDYGFENFSNTLNLMEREERRFSNTETWHRRFVARRELRLLEQQRRRREYWEMAERNRVIDVPFGTPKKVRKSHIRWEVDGF